MPTLYRHFDVKRALVLPLLYKTLFWLTTLIALCSVKHGAFSVVEATQTIERYYLFLVPWLILEIDWFITTGFVFSLARAVNACRQHRTIALTAGAPNLAREEK